MPEGEASGPLSDWVADAFGYRPVAIELFERAVTHSSRVDGRGHESYERQEFLGDRVLGLVMAEWLYETFPDEPEGLLSKRFNALVTGAVCAEVARSIGAVQHLRLGKQARDDGAAHSDHVLGDVMEALLGALYRERGLAAARDVIRRLWAGRLEAEATAPQHPKSALQEWAAANRRAVPAYTMLNRSGPGHAPRFTVKVAVGKDETTATGASKQEAETAAATALLATLVATTKPKKRRR